MTVFTNFQTGFKLAHWASFNLAVFHARWITLDVVFRPFPLFWCSQRPDRRFLLTARSRLTSFFLFFVGKNAVNVHSAVSSRPLNRRIFLFSFFLWSQHVFWRDFFSKNLIGRRLETPRVVPPSVFYRRLAGCWLLSLGVLWAAENEGTQKPQRFTKPKHQMKKGKTEADKTAERQKTKTAITRLKKTKNKGED